MFLMHLPLIFLCNYAFNVHNLGSVLIYSLVSEPVYTVGVGIWLNCTAHGYVQKIFVVCKAKKHFCCQRQVVLRFLRPMTAIKIIS